MPSQRLDQLSLAQFRQNGSLQATTGCNNIHAEVLIDGEPWQGGAQDERLVVELGAGPHRIEIRKAGYRTYMTDVTVRSGETTPLNVAMTRSEN